MFNNRLDEEKMSKLENMSEESIHTELSILKYGKKKGKKNIEQYRNEHKGPREHGEKV